MTNESNRNTLKVITLGNPVLREKARLVLAEEIKSREVQELIDGLIVIMRRSDGVGIAAPQVGHLIAAIAVELRSNSRHPSSPEIPLQVLFNPKITYLSKEMVSDWEGCLSVPGYRGMVPRSKELTVEGLNRVGKSVEIKADNLGARIFQHEIDHLNGTLFLDRMKDFSTLMTMEEFNLMMRRNNTT